MRLARWFVGLLAVLSFGLGCSTNHQPQGSPKTESKLPRQLVTDKTDPPSGEQNGGKTAEFESPKVPSDNVSGSSNAWGTTAIELKRLKGEIDNLGKDIKRLKGDIDNLGKEIKRNSGDVARATAEANAFAKNVQDARANLEKRLVELKALDKDPKTSDGVFAKKWQMYKVAEAAVASQEKLLKRKQDLVRDMRAKLAAKITAGQELETRVADIETQLATARLAQPKGLVQIEDSGVGKVKDALDDLHKRIKVLQKRMESEPIRVEEDVRGVEPTRVERNVKGDEARKEFRARFGGRTP